MLERTRDYIESATLRTLFDQMADHLMAQGRKSYDELEDICMYRAPDGCKCAVGVLIEQHEYDDDIEGHSVEHILWDLSYGKLKLLKLFQGIHDGFEPSEWEGRIRLFASSYNFNWKPKQ